MPCLSSPSTALTGWSMMQVHEDFRVKEEARLAVVRETEELEAELKEVQRQTEEQAM